MKEIKESATQQVSYFVLIISSSVSMGCQLVYLNEVQSYQKKKACKRGQARLQPDQVARFIQW